MRRRRGAHVSETQRRRGDDTTARRRRAETSVSFGSRPYEHRRCRRLQRWNAGAVLSKELAKSGPTGKASPFRRYRRTLHLAEHHGQSNRNATRAALASLRPVSTKYYETARQRLDRAPPPGLEQYDAAVSAIPDGPCHRHKKKPTCAFPRPLFARTIFRGESRRRRGVSTGYSETATPSEPADDPRRSRSPARGADAAAAWIVRGRGDRDPNAERRSTGWDGAGSKRLRRGKPQAATSRTTARSSGASAAAST